jgi:hypothetical protein
MSLYRGRGTAEGLAEIADIANGPCLVVGDCMPPPGREPAASARDVPVSADAAPCADGDCRCGAAALSALADQDEVPVARLAHLYLCTGLSTYRIAQLTGLDRQRVTRRLRRAGVPLRPRGAGGSRPQARRPDPPEMAAMLTELYVTQRLSTPEIGRLLGIPERRVRDRLRRYGIPARTRGGWQREDRRSLPTETLHQLYQVLGLSADDVGRKLDASRKIVLRTAHDLGMPVRASAATAATRPGPDEIQLIDALYADGLVRATLAEHGIAGVPAGGPIWQRFPQPVPLTRQLVTGLYWGCGIGLHHVELVTGQPAHTVRGFMRRARIPVRDPGGQSPFLRRWRLVASQPYR